MVILSNLGLTEEEILQIFETCKNLKNIPEEDLIINIEILKQIGCKEKHIRNILITNPDYLLKDKEDIILLINKLNQLNITHLYLLINSNPFLLTLEPFELEEFISQKQKEGKTLEDIKNLIENNPYIIEE